MNQYALMLKAAQPPLNAASSRGHYEVVELLLDSGASVNAMDGVSVIHISYACVLCTHMYMYPSGRADCST